MDGAVSTGTTARTHAQREARIAPEKPRDVLTELDHFNVRPEEVREAEARVETRAEREALDRALDQERATERELREIFKGIEASLETAGVDLQEAYSLKGAERIFDGLGRFFGSETLRNRAVALQRQRIESIHTEELCAGIRHQAQQAQIRAATVIEGATRTRDAYEEVITNQLEKLRTSTPLYEKKMVDLEKLTGERNEQNLVLNSGTLELKDRAQAEKAFEEIERKLSLLARETRQLAIEMRVTQESIPELQKSRETAVKNIESIEQMRRELHEELEAFLVILENAPQAMRARLAMEHFDSVRPALRRAVTTINDNNVATAIAGMESAKAAITGDILDPVRSSEQTQKLLRHTAKYLEGIAELDASITKGARGRAQTPDPDSSQKR